MSYLAKYDQKLTAGVDHVIVLVGLKHCGKSSVGKLLAKTMGRTHYDGDELLEECYALQQSSMQNLSFRDIYRTLGKEGFDLLQLQVLKGFLAQRDGASLESMFSMSSRLSKLSSLPAPVLSLGGGIGDLDEVAAILGGENCLVVLLEEELRALFERIMQGGLPSFLRNATSPEQAYTMFCQLGEERLQRYRKWATLIVNCQQRKQQELLLELEQRLS